MSQHCVELQEPGQSPRKVQALGLTAVPLAEAEPRQEEEPVAVVEIVLIFMKKKENATPTCAHDHIQVTIFSCLKKFTFGTCLTGCFENDKRYVGHPLNKPKGNNDYGATKDAFVCQKLCQNTDGCMWFNLDVNQHCWLKTARGKGEGEPGSITGPVNCTDGKVSTKSKTFKISYFS